MRKRFSIPPLPLTREHGSWAVLAVPLIVGTAAADRVLWGHGLLAIAALSAFLSYIPAQLLLQQGASKNLKVEALRAARFWAISLFGAALLAASVLVLRGEEHLLLWALWAGLGFVGHAVFTKGKGKSMWGDFFAVGGLSAGAPAAAMLGSELTASDAILLWMKVFLFFGCSVVYVHMKIRAAARRLAEPLFWRRIRFGWVTIGYHLIVIVIVAAAVSSGPTPLPVLAAYMPMAVHAAIGTVRLTATVRFKRLGFLLLAHSIFFAVVMVYSLQRGI